jgi:hypothetical protein
MSSLLALFLSSGSSGTDLCGMAGFQRTHDYYHTDYSWEDCDEALVSYTGVLAHYLGLQGSYIASESGQHRFRLWRAVSGVSQAGGVPEVDFEVDGNYVTVTASVNPYDASRSLIPYFRYSLHAYYSRGEDQYNSEMRLEIALPGSLPLSTISNVNGGETCRRSGCADMALNRAPSMCRPAPTLSSSPQATRVATGTATFTAAPLRIGSRRRYLRLSFGFVFVGLRG